MSDITYRRGTLEDSFRVWDVMQASILDLGARQGVMPFTGGNDPEAAAQFWTRRKPFFEHLARTAHEFWIAERDGSAVGYARSILRDGVLELTEFFVVPGAQSAGVGTELLQQTFPHGVGAHRVIIATTDVRAQIQYLRAGVVPQFPEMWWARKPENVTVETDLEFVRAANDPATLAQLAALDRAIVGHRRDVDHAFLLEDREGYVYKRAGSVVGYGYLSLGCGPIALLEGRDSNAVLAHAERRAFERGFSEVGFDIPMINRAAIDYFLAHRYKLDPFVAFYMSDAPMGKLENYVLTSPPFFV